VNLGPHFSVQLDTSQLTHFKTAIDDTNSGAWDLKPPLNLSDGAFGVSPRQGFGEITEGKYTNKDLSSHKGRKEIKLEDLTFFGGAEAIIHHY
jgi:hypothetical protein